MMSELIFTSLFCNEMDEFYASDDVIRADTKAPTTRSLTTQVSTSQSPNLRPTTAQIRSPCAVDAEIPENDLEKALREFKVRVTEGARTDVSTFENRYTQNIFASEYISSISHDISLTEDKATETKATRQERYQIHLDSRPPYTFAAMAAVAIYASGKPALNASEIECELLRLFGSNAFSIKRTMRKNITRALKRYAVFRAVSSCSITYELVPSCVNPDMFKRKSNATPNACERYATSINEHLDLPDMLTDLAKGKTSPDEADKLFDQTPQTTKTTRRKRKSSNDGKQKPTKRARLSMPPLPCFQDNNDDGEDELFVSLSQASGVPDFADDVLPHIQTHAQQQEVSKNADILQHQPGNQPQSPSSSSSAPLASCQQVSVGQYFIAGSGTVTMVDVLVNGRILKVPITPVFSLIPFSV